MTNYDYGEISIGNFVKDQLDREASKSHLIWFDKLQSNTTSDIDIIWVVMQRFSPLDGCDVDYFRYETLKDLVQILEVRSNLVWNGVWIIIYFVLKYIGQGFEKWLAHSIYQKKEKTPIWVKCTILWQCWQCCFTYSHFARSWRRPRIHEEFPYLKLQNHFHFSSSD